jgi:4-amino-4-deoxy-L-arabinose transferase-like glycosyltransferase
MDEETGFIAAAICSFFPINYSFSVQFNLELATASVMSMIICFLLVSDKFKNTYYSVLLGIALGVGMLTRIFIPLFIAVPVIFTLLGKKSCAGKAGIKQFKNIMITMGIAALIALIYYHKAGDFVLALRKTTELSHVMGRNLFSLEHIFFYLKLLPEQAGTLSTLFFILSLGIVMRRMDHLKGVIVWWFAASFLMLTIIPLKQPEFAIFYMPPIAIIVALGLNNIKNKFLRKYFAVLLVVVQMGIYFYDY